MPDALPACPCPEPLPILLLWPCAGVPGEGDPIPAWLRKWAALALGFVEAEAAGLPALLTAQPNPNSESGAHFSPEEAAAEAKSLLGGRVQALAVALDKAKLFLRHQVGVLGRGAQCWVAAMREGGSFPLTREGRK